MIIIYIDIILLVILLCLTVFTCGYCFYRVYRMQLNGQIEVLLRPKKVVFAQKKDGESTEELRTVVAYQNPLTGEFCVHKSQPPRVYCNPRPQPASPDSGLSDEYEPLNLEPVHLPRVSVETPDGLYPMKILEDPPQVPKRNDDNSLNKTWNWNYTEYQI